MLNINRNNQTRKIESDKKTIKALLVDQPFAWAISENEKKIEIRSWQTKYRGDLLICSTKKKFKFDGEILPAGKALCIANLVDCRPMVESDSELALVDKIDKNMFSWVFGAILLFTPFLIVGKQRLFDVTIDINKLEVICLQYYSEQQHE